MNKAAYGHVYEIKAVNSQAVTRIVIELPIEAHVDATSLFYGKEVLVTIAPSGIGQYGILGVKESEPPGISAAKETNQGEAYRQLHAQGWFYRPDVCQAMGSDDDFLAWLRTQRCAYCGEVGREGNKIEAAHVRRVANGAGTGIKPWYSAIPLCHEHHALQHQKGEGELGGKEWFDKKLGENKVAWIKSVIYDQLNVTSLREISLPDFVAFCDVLGIANTLPSAFME